MTEFEYLATFEGRPPHTFRDRRGDDLALRDARRWRGFRELFRKTDHGYVEVVS